jgi:predicted DNA-binding transcriptional regulator YafY
MNIQLNQRRDLICNAIAEKKIIQFRYDGYTRIVEPFCCGINTKDNYVLRSFQIGGHSSTKKNGWKMFDLADISKLEILDDRFEGNRKGYNPKDSAMVKFFCHIPKSLVN